MKETISCGICCLRKKNNKYEFVMVKKNCSYSFFNFTLGKYEKNMRNMFNNMTFDEKNIICSRNYEFVFYNCYRNRKNVKISKKKYAKLEKKYNNFINSNSFKDIFNTVNIDDLWEFPKGKLENNENMIECAMREFEEETSIMTFKYKVLFDVEPLILNKIHNGINYKSIYYFAIYLSNHDDLTFKYDFNPEVCEKAWRFVNDKQLKKKILDKVKSYFKPKYLPPF